MKKPYAPLCVRNLRLGDGTPRICVPLTPSSPGQLDRQLDEVLSAPCDILEWRADYWQGRPDVFEESDDFAWAGEVLGRIRARAGDRPLLFTFRSAREGGERDLPGDRYQELARTAARTHLADLLDLEYSRGGELLASLIPALKQEGVRIVGSFHDFHTTPAAEQITHILTDMQLLGCDISKIALMPQSRRDVLTLMEASLQMEEGLADRPFVTISMGPLGQITRLAGAFTGSAFTFAAAGRASAPGQMAAGEVSRALRLFERIETL